MRRHTRAVSLIELLACVAIVAILCTIAVVSYEIIFVKMDSTDLNDTLGRIADALKTCRKQATDGKAIIVVEFLQGEAAANVTTKSAQSEVKKKTELKARGTFNRPLAFREYKWPDGTTTPRTWTFMPDGAIEGGTVYFGSNHAQGHLWIDEHGAINYHNDAAPS